MTIFLATTALRAFWPEASRLTLLGRWCLPGPELYESATGNAGEFDLLPCPWDDPREFARAADYTADSYERALICVSGALNAFHGLDKPPQYWRIIVGPWLSVYVQALYDRYACLALARRRDPDVVTISLHPSCFSVPKDYEAFMQMIATDEYNLQLYTEVLDGIGAAVEYRPLPATPSSASPSHAATKRRGLRRLLRPLKLALERAVVVHSKVALVGTALPRRDGWRLWIRSRGAIGCADGFGQDVGATPVDSEGRRSLGHTIQTAMAADDQFHAVIGANIADDIPQAYVEDFATRRRRISCRGTLPKVLLSAMSLYSDEDFKILAAEAQERGSTLLSTQHGGSYGISRFHLQEAHQETIATTFYSWGWTEGLATNASVKPLPALRLVAAASLRSRQGGADPGPIVCLTTMQYRYVFRFHSHPVGPQWTEYIRWQLRFQAALGDEVRKRVVVRPYDVASHGWPLRAAWEKEFPRTNFDGVSTLKSLFASASLVVIDHPSTVQLEAMVADVPTVLFWDPLRFTLRHSAEPYFAGLREAGILHDSPEAAAGSVLAILDRAGEWWRSDGIRAAKRRFCDQFAATSADWLARWQTELLSKAR